MGTAPVSEADRLYATARALTGSLTASEVASAVFEHCLADLGASTAGLWLLEAGTVRFAGGAGHVEHLARYSGPISLDSGLPGPTCIRTGEIVWYGSLAERDRRWPNLAGMQSTTETLVVLPLNARDRSLGALHIGYPVPMSYDEIDVSFLTKLAELCGAALDRAQLFDAERERQAFLLDASAVLADASGYVDTLEKLAAIAVPRLADVCLIDVKEPNDRIRRMAAVCADPAKAPLVQELQERYAPGDDVDHPARQVMNSGRSRWSPTMSETFLQATARDERHLDLVKQLGFRSFMCVPLLGVDEILGTITLVSAGSGRRFERDDLALPEELASRIASVVAAARRHEQEHQLAHELQLLLLPETLPEPPELEIAVRYLTAAVEAEAGGDFYDVVRLPGDRIGIAIGDVEGHDAVAAATMGQLRSAARALAGQAPTPSRLVDSLRWSWDLLGFPRIATALFALVDPATGEMLLTSAGHPAPIHIDSGGRAAIVPVQPSPPLGVPGPSAPETRFVLGEGETLFFYTDGLIEQRRASGDDELGRLLAVLSDTGDTPLETLCDWVIEAQAPGRSRHDDIAIIAVRRRPLSPS
jgi:serine phosphatase RsbU (regulator of sigma subunit)